MSQDPIKPNITSGFTLIELLLAMSFVAALLLAVATTIIQMSSVYTHGFMLTSINRAARTISASLTSDIQSSPAIDLTKQLVDNSGGGRLCLNGYTYIWNLTKPDNKNKYASTDGTAAPPITLSKVADSGASYCSSTNNSNQIPYSSTSVQRNVELLDDGSHDLILQQFKVSKIVSDSVTQESLYSVYFVISTNSGSDILAPHTTNNPNTYYICAPPSLASGDSNRCAVQDFTVVIRASNGA